MLDARGLDPAAANFEGVNAFALGADTVEVKRLDELVRKALEVNPNDGNNRNAEASLAFIQGRDDEAIVELERAIAFDPSNIDDYSFLGDIYFLTGQEENAVSVLDKALRLSPRDPGLARLLLFKAFALLVLGRDAEASGLINQALTLLPNDRQIMRVQAATLANLGRVAEARELYRRYAALTGAQLATVAQYRAYLMTLAGAKYSDHGRLPRALARRPAQGRDAGGVNLGLSRSPR